MANRARNSSSKGRNGVGDTVVVSFDLADPAERKALEAARLLATKHGRRKQAIVALLGAVYAHYEQTGELLSAADITAGLIGQGRVVEHVKVSSNAVGEFQSPRERIEKIPQLERSRPSRTVEVTASGKASTSEVAKNFLSSMSSFMDG